MMNLTGEQIEEVIEMAGLFFDPETIAINLQLSDQDAEYFVGAVQCKLMQEPAVSAYYSGRLAAQVALRAAIKQSASNGSSPSQLQMIRFMNESE